MGCIHPMMHYRSQHCWELLQPYAHLCQYERNNSQQCWADIVGICCNRTHTTANTNATTPSIVGSWCIRMHTTDSTNATTSSIVGPTLLGVGASVCTPLTARTQQLPALLGQHCWELLHRYAQHCQHGRNNSQQCWAEIVGSYCMRIRITAVTNATNSPLHVTRSFCFTCIRTLGRK